jgi:hypothetical protein
MNKTITTYPVDPVTGQQNTPAEKDSNITNEEVQTPAEKDSNSTNEEVQTSATTPDGGSEQSESTTDQAVVQPNPLPSVIKATFKIGDSIYSGDIQLTEGPGVTVPQKGKTNLLSKFNPFNNKGGKTAKRAKRARRTRGRTLRKKRRN